MGADEKHAATYHGGEYTPSTGQVRNAYGAHLADCRPVSTDALNEFDRWLETVRAEAKAEALHEVLNVLQAEIEDAPPANHEEDNYEAGYIAGLDFLLNSKSLANQYKEQS